MPPRQNQILLERRRSRPDVRVLFERALRSHIALAESLSGLAEETERFALEAIRALRDGRKILLMGNGGSAATCQHFAAELVGAHGPARPMAAIALTTDTSVLTALGNDFSFARIFSQQVDALARAGDLAVGISTSGASENVAKGLSAARERGCRTVGVLGRGNGIVAAVSDVALIVDSGDVPRIQECHLLIVHSVAEAVNLAFSHGP